MGSVQTVIQALHHAQAGEWKEAHDLIDELEHPLAYWLHASLHREEGDQDNRLQENDLIARLGDVSAVRCGGTGGAGGQPGVGDRTYFPAAAPWTRDVTTAAKDANSDAIIAWAIATSLCLSRTAASCTRGGARTLMAAAFAAGVWLRLS